MLRNIFIVVSCIFSFLVVSGCGSEPKIQPITQQSVILAFGDSLTHGTGALQGQSYPDVLGGLLGHLVINVGVPGEITELGLKRLPAILDQYNPSLVILCHGGNDFLQRLPKENTIANLKGMIEAIRDRGADVVLIGVPKLAFGLAIPEYYDEIAESYDIPFEGEILLDLLDDNDLKSDAIHPNARGYSLMAEAVYRLIKTAQEK